MADITDKEGKNIKISSKDANFKEALRKPTVMVDDKIKAEKGDFSVVHVFDGKNVDEFYEIKLQETPYPVTYRRSIKQLSEQYRTDPHLGGVLLRKDGSNVFNFVPKDSSKDKVAKSIEEVAEKDKKVI